MAYRHIAGQNRLGYKNIDNVAEVKAELTRLIGKEVILSGGGSFWDSPRSAILNGVEEVPAPLGKEGEVALRLRLSEVTPSIRESAEFNPILGSWCIGVMQ